MFFFAFLSSLYKFSCIDSHVNSFGMYKLYYSFLYSPFLLLPLRWCNVTFPIRETTWNIPKVNPLRAQQANAIYRFVTMVYWYNSQFWTLSTVLPFFFIIQLNSIGLSVPHRKHITSPLQGQQVNVIYRLVTMVYWYNSQFWTLSIVLCVLWINVSETEFGLSLLVEPTQTEWVPHEVRDRIQSPERCVWKTVRRLTSRILTVIF
jgi:hypothetical protein